MLQSFPSAVLFYLKNVNKLVDFNNEIKMFLIFFLILKNCPSWSISNAKHMNKEIKKTRNEVLKKISKKIKYFWLRKYK